jgi:hypothetical protein
MRRLLEAIADSENDHPGEAGEKYYVDFSRKDAMDAVARIVELRSALSTYIKTLKDLIVAIDRSPVQTTDDPDVLASYNAANDALAALEALEKTNG